MGASSWTDELIATLRDRHAAGRTMSEIVIDIWTAHGVSVSRNAVISKVHRLHMPARKSQEPRVSKPRAETAKREHKPRSFAPKPKLVVVPKPVAPPIPEPIGREGVPFLDHREGQCRWPLWDFLTPFSGKRFCGEPVAGKGPYCAYCQSLSYEPTRSAA